jgi:N-acetyltransferase
VRGAFEVRRVLAVRALGLPDSFLAATPARVLSAILMNMEQAPHISGPEALRRCDLVGRIVRLEPIDERHREGLREAAEREPQIHRYTNMYTLGFDGWFDVALANEREVPYVVLVDGRPAGSSRYLNVEPAHRRVEIGWTWLERAHWGTGANVETKYLLLRNAFESWGAMRVEFKTDARNLRVRGALLGVGASFEGIFRKHMVLPDSIRDSAWYAILDDEWPRVRPMLEAKIARHAP